MDRLINLYNQFRNIRLYYKFKTELIVCLSMLSLLSLYLLSECGGQGDQPPSGDLHLRPGVQRVLQHQGHTPLLKECV